MSLHFGIPTLDHLLGDDLPDLLRGVGSRPDRDVIDFDTPPKPMDTEDEEGFATSYCILGPDGTGKSILALHLIARYAREVEIEAHTKLFLLISKVKETLRVPPAGLTDEDRETLNNLVLQYEDPDKHENRARIYQAARPRLIYASTDMSFQKAKVSWNNFGLHYAPRIVPFMLRPEHGVEYLIPRDYSFDFDRHRLRSQLKLKLLTANVESEQHEPSSTISKFISHSVNEPCVGFLDLEASTAGDDWGYVNRVLAALPPVRVRNRRDKTRFHSPAIEDVLVEFADKTFNFNPKTPNEVRVAKTEYLRGLLQNKVQVVHQPKVHPHLLVIDAVQGLETLAGEMDPYGVVRTRRSRVAQAIRTAKEKCHLIFVSEEVEDERLPEEFVTNVVIKLRAKQERDYSRRTLEIVKGRTTQHVRGQHFYVLRNGKGSTTGFKDNPDDPRLDFHYAKNVYGVDLDREWDRFADPCRPKPEQQSYFMSFLSLNARYSDFMKDRITNVLRKEMPDRGRASFGYPFLDSLIEDGFHLGTVNALIGDEGTRKSRMARAFLSGCYADLITTPSKEYMPPGVGVLLSVQDLFAPQASALLAEHLVPPVPRAKADDDVSIEKRKKDVRELSERIDNRFIYRRFTIGQITATHFFFIVEHAVVRARKELEEIIDDEFRTLCKGFSAFKFECHEGRFLDLVISHLLKTVIRTAYRDRWQSVVDGKSTTGTCQDFDPIMKRFSELLDALKLKTKTDPAETTSRHRSEVLARLDRELTRFVKSVMTTEMTRSHAEHLVRQLQTVFRIASEQIDFVIKYRLESEETLIQDEAKWDRLIWPEIDERIRRQFYYESSGRIRVVIDDWSNIYRTYPEIRGDSIFLPFLIFFLRRWNVTALIAETRSDTWGARLNDDTVELQQKNLSMLVDFRLFTTRVNFHGKECAAVRAVPASLAQSPIAVREVKAGNEGENSERFIVDPHFELYKGILTGHPQRVPLKVYFYIPGNKKKNQGLIISPDSSSSESTSSHSFLTAKLQKAVPGQSMPPESNVEVEQYPLSMRYWEQEALLLKELFRVNDEKWDNDIVPLDRQLDYATLRDFCHLRGKANLEHTLVIQVDEFWDRENDHLADIEIYLKEKTAANHSDAKFEDPYELFNAPVIQDMSQLSKHTHQDRYVLFQELAKRIDRKEPPQANGSTLRRIDRFKLESYDFNTSDNREFLFNNRIPYYWDFGFLMCSNKDWESCQDQEVQKVWDKLCRADNWPTYFRSCRSSPSGRTEPSVSWFEFFKACWKIKEELKKKQNKSRRAFDIDVMGAETLNCCVLEIWMSELIKVRTAYRAAAKGVEQSFLNEIDEFTFRGGRHPRLSFGLLDLVGSGQINAPVVVLREALYRTFLLLGAILEPAQIKEMIDQSDMTVREHAAAGNPIAARHWYSTASRMVRDQDGKLNHNYTPVRMPGSFSTRGDWDLAIARGSQSSRLGLHAIDLISSRRANVERFRYGIGLPVRDAVPDPFRFALRSSLPSPRRDTDPSTAKAALHSDPNEFPSEVLCYSDLRALGGWNADECGAQQQGFHWLWRSALNDYDRHSRVFGIWIGYMLSHWKMWMDSTFKDKVVYKNEESSFDGFIAYEAAFEDIKNLEPFFDREKIESHYGRKSVDHLYDRSKNNDLPKLLYCGSFEFFNERCDYLEAALRQASRNKSRTTQDR